MPHDTSNSTIVLLNHQFYSIIRVVQFKKKKYHENKIANNTWSWLLGPYIRYTKITNVRLRANYQDNFYFRNN